MEVCATISIVKMFYSPIGFRGQMGQESKICSGLLKYIGYARVHECLPTLPPFFKVELQGIPRMSR